MTKVNYYEENYCIGLIKSALSPNGKNGNLNKCAIKEHILKKVESIKDLYGLSHEDIFSAICFHFLRKSIITKINDDKGCPTTFILHYVFNQLRNIERSCARGNFDSTPQNSDAMDRIAFHIEDLDNDGDWLPELASYNDPESLLIARHTLEELQDRFGEYEISLLIGDLSIEEYCIVAGISQRSAYRRLARLKALLEKNFYGGL